MVDAHILTSANNIIVLGKTELFVSEKNVLLRCGFCAGPCARNRVEIYSTYTTLKFGEIKNVSGSFWGVC